MNSITTTIGNNQNSNLEDVKQVRKKLNFLGLNSGDEDRGYIDQDLDTAIRVFQRGADLKEDGVLKPKGETEARLNHIMQFVRSDSKIPPKPLRKPFRPPIPDKKPLPPQKGGEVQIIVEKIKKIKEEKEKELLIKKLYDFVKKKNPVGFMKELPDKTQEIHNDTEDSI